MIEDIQRMRDGDASKYNSSLDILRRINLLWDQANRARQSDYGNGAMEFWVKTLHALDSELCSFLNEEEEKTLDVMRVRVPGDKLPNYVKMLLHPKIDRYERQLRMLFHSKGFGLRAGEDVGSAILR